MGKSSLVNRLSRRARGGRARAAGRHARPQGGARPSGTAARFALVDTGGVDLADADALAGLVRDQARAALADAAGRAARGRRAGRAAARRRRAGRPAAPLGRAGRRRRQQDRRASRDVPLAAEFHGLGLGEPLAGLRRAGPGHRRPARPRSSARLPEGDAEEDDDDRAPGRHRPAQRRQVLAGQPLPGRGAGDRLRRGRAPRATRSTRARGRRPPGGARRHRRAAPRSPRSPESVEYYAALRSRAGGRARRRRARGLRRDRRRHQRRTCGSPSWRCRPSAPRVLALNKWDADGEDVDLDARARPRGAEAAPAPAGADRVSAKTGRNVQPPAGRGARRWPTARAQRIPTPELNRFLGEVRPARQPPAKRGRRLKLLYMAQIETRPAALRDPGQRPQPGDARLRLLPREPPARALRARGRARWSSTSWQRGGARRRGAEPTCRGGADLATAVAALRRAAGGGRRRALVLAARRRGGGRAARRRGAARLVPADALVYLHLSTDAGGRRVKRAARSLAKFPSYPRLRDALLRSLSGGGGRRSTSAATSSRGSATRRRSRCSTRRARPPARS